MNRPGVGPQAMRGMPNGFPNQQQIQNRNVSNRIPPSGKMANNGATWAFGGVPMGGAGLGNPRPNNGPMTSFAQTIGGGSSQPATPLDLSEFPSLSGNQPQHNQSTWGAAGTRNIGPSNNMRLQQSAGLPAQHTQQQQQDELFNSSSQLPSNQGGFRFGAQNNINQSSQPNSADEFPPLSRNSNGEIGQDRGSNLLQNVGFGGFGAGNQPQQGRGNGLLNALSGNGRAVASNRTASPASLSGPPITRSPIDSNRQGLSSVGENDIGAFSNSHFGSANPTQLREDESQQQFNMNSASGSRADPPPQLNDALSHSQSTGNGSTQRNPEEPNSKIQDPLAHMSDTDKYGLKGFSFMMNNFPDYAALVTGTDIAHLGLDLNSSDLISTQIYSLWENEPPRPDVTSYKLPDCYRVHNIAPLETKMSNFNDEALLFMFYSNPGDKQQLMAARELGNRNWRYHKKLQFWLTKDDLMVPRQISPHVELGYYIYFDVKTWSRQRREFQISYEDLEKIEDRNYNL
ncbi:transcriptional regulator [Clarireedia jacksonii]